MEEAVVFEAAAAEERVEGVQRLLPLHRLGEGSIQVGGAQWRQLHQAWGLKEVFVSADKKKKARKIRARVAGGCDSSLVFLIAPSSQKPNSKRLLSSFSRETSRRKRDLLALSSQSACVAMVNTKQWPV